MGEFIGRSKRVSGSAPGPRRVPQRTVGAGRAPGALQAAGPAFGLAAPVQRQALPEEEPLQAQADVQRAMLPGEEEEEKPL